ncbi:hypothetical protein M9H77_16697 [Catharanthus roseus]|uniref:Uncharacterized protein n=1 Tax=Catharanthus roseus TaxID=4058 RepID=A0ACC0B2G9_CATRO|nr:hypothetical protein M9H77_16697 [Catharanthus roseus]
MENKRSPDYNNCKKISFFTTTSYLCFDHFLKTKLYSLILDRISIEVSRLGNNHTMGLEDQEESVGKELILCNKNSSIIPFLKASLLSHEVSYVDLKLFLECYISHVRIIGDACAISFGSGLFLVVPCTSECLYSHASFQDSLLNNGAKFDPSCNDFGLLNNASFVDPNIVGFELQCSLITSGFLSFLSPGTRKYPSGSHCKREIDCGYWNATGEDRDVKLASTVIGKKKTLVFHTGQALKGQRQVLPLSQYQNSHNEVTYIKCQVVTVNVIISQGDRRQKLAHQVVDDYLADFLDEPVECRSLLSGSSLRQAVNWMLEFETFVEVSKMDSDKLKSPSQTTIATAVEKKELPDELVEIDLIGCQKIGRWRWKSIPLMPLQEQLLHMILVPVKKILPIGNRISISKLMYNNVRPSKEDYFPFVESTSNFKHTYHHGLCFLLRKNIIIDQVHAMSLSINSLENYENPPTGYVHSRKANSIKTTSMFSILSYEGTAVYTSPSTSIHVMNSSVSDWDASPFCVLETVQN